MNTFVKWVKEHAKTVAVFAATYLANAVLSLINGETPWPTTGEEWSQYGFTIIGAMVAAWLARNKITQKQLDKDPDVVGGVVVESTPSAPVVVSGRKPWPKP